MIMMIMSKMVMKMIAKKMQCNAAKKIAKTIRHVRINITKVVMRTMIMKIMIIVMMSKIIVITSNNYSNDSCVEILPRSEDKNILGESS